MSRRISADLGFSISLVFKLFSSIFSLGTFLTFLLLFEDVVEDVVSSLTLEDGGDFLQAVFS